MEGTQLLYFKSNNVQFLTQEKIQNIFCICISLSEVFNVFFLFLMRQNIYNVMSGTTLLLILYSLNSSLLFSFYFMLGFTLKVQFNHGSCLYESDVSFSSFSVADIHSY